MSFFIFLLLTNILGAFEIHGHRGARAIWPENSLAAFEYAIKNEIDVLEMDLAYSKDNVLVVHHDESIDLNLCQYMGNKKTNSLIIRKLSLNQIKEFRCGFKQNSEFKNQNITSLGFEIPTFAEVLSLIALSKSKKIRLNIEIKVFNKDFYVSQEEYIETLLTLIKKYNMQERAIIQSFEPNIILRVKEKEPAIKTSLLVKGRMRFFKKFIGANSYLDLAKAAKANIISPHYKIITHQEIQELKENNIQVIPWTANEKNDWSDLISWEVDGIITDDPVGLKNYLKKNENNCDKPKTFTCQF